MKKFLALILALTMICSLAACGQSAPAAQEAAPAAEAPAADAPAADAPAEPALEPVTLKIYAPGSGVPLKTIEKYAELVAEASNGVITLDVHGNGELGDDADSIDATRMGTIDIIYAGTSGFTSFYEPAKILDLPFLFGSADEAYEIVNGEIGEKIFEGFKDFGLVYLSSGDNGLRQIATTTKPINSAEDVKGLKIRVPTSQMYLDVWEALGATPVALALPELAIALSNGTAEAQDNATYHLVANATYDDIKHFSFINYMWMGITMAINANTWDKLQPEAQAILKEQAIAAAKFGFELIAADNEAGTETLKEAGIEFNYEPDVQSFKDALGGAAYYDRYKDQAWFNQEILDAILAK